jgi:nucleotide-binding universal stress UspA family protein
MFKLLIGYDGSDDARAAIDDLVCAGLPSEVETCVMSIADLLPSMPGQEFVKVYPDSIRSARFHVEEALAGARVDSAEGAARVAKLFPKFKIHSEVAADSPYWALVKKADELRADLLVVGSEGRSAFGRLILGSVSMNAALYASCSVRVGRRRGNEHANSASDPVRLIVGWDGSTSAGRVVHAIGLRKWPVGSSARVVTAIDQRLASALPYDLSAELAGTEPLLDQSEPLLRTANVAVEHLRKCGLAVDEPILREGDPKRVLLDEATTWYADCIFVGAKGLSRIARVLLGSVSSAVAARASCSVEVVRAAG